MATCRDHSDPYTCCMGDRDSEAVGTGNGGEVARDSCESGVGEVVVGEGGDNREGDCKAMAVVDTCDEACMVDEG